MCYPQKPMWQLESPLFPQIIGAALSYLALAGQLFSQGMICIINKK
ncbi:hypothetical protein SAMN05216603_1441 [Pseudomonas benzenivorans]|nr:hypothetical protein SAMN05216603_1441 [Pseudomonas benzenivorans]